VGGSGATLVLGTGVVIKDNHRTDGSAGGIAVNGGGVLHMEDGEISGHTSTTRGGGISVNGGTFIMSGGKIFNNSTNDRGGGVEVDLGTFTMSGDAKIYGNTANRYGGGVMLVSGVQFSKTGNASITGPGDTNPNNAQGSGGTSPTGHAVYVAPTLGSGINSQEKYRNATAGAGVDLHYNDGGDTTTGWE
jgi:hypothetical protein